MRSLKLSFLLCGALVSCGVSHVDDESMYLEGTEEHAITDANGQKTCAAPKKVVVCHIPPGNPANAHDICVGASALDAHQANHGDTLGACETTEPPEPEEPGDGDGDGDGDGGVVTVVGIPALRGA